MPHSKHVLRLGLGLCACLATLGASQDMSPLISLSCCSPAYATELHAQQDPWTIEDFVIEGDTLYGLSAQGLEKLKAQDGALKLPTQGEGGQALIRIASFAFTPNKSVAIEEYTGREGIGGEISDEDVDGRVIKKLGENFGNTLIKSVVIPSNYVSIGQDAFVSNKNLSKLELSEGLQSISDYAFAHTALSSLSLPNSLQKITDQVFFDNSIGGTLRLPASLKELGERAFKGNKIESVVFGDAPLQELKESVFEDNKLSKLALSAHINKIHPSAFGSNPGDLEYGGFVVLETPSGANPQGLSSAGNFYIDPSDDKKTTLPELDYSQWTEDDFSFLDGTITGFSGQGELKVRKNKALEIPATYKGAPVIKIGPNAFRNVDLSGQTIKKYDLESVSLPDTIEEIGSFAFQSNNITEFMPDVDAPLKRIGDGAFMNNKITDLLLPSSLEYIGDAAFHINSIGFVLIPRETTYLGRSAFRQNTVNFLGFEEGAKLERIEEIAFGETHLETADFSNATKLREIGIQAFANNELAGELSLPDSLETIEPEAFSVNQLTKLMVPASMKAIAFNALDANPGDPEHNNKVLVDFKTPVEEHSLADGNNFIVAPQLKAKNSSKLDELLQKLQEVKPEELREETAQTIKELKDQGAALKEKENLSQGELAQFAFNAQFFLDRLPLDGLIKKADKLIADSVGEEEDRKLLSEKLDYVKAHFNNAAWTPEKLARAERELRLLSDLVLKQNEMGKARMVQGVHELHSTLPIPAYYIGLQVYVNPDDTILYVLDRSYSIGEGQNDEWGNPIPNVDEDNEGYHELALATLADYEGKKVSDILSHTVDTLGGIREIPRAPEHRAGIYAAVVDALTDYLKEKDPASDRVSDVDLASGIGTGSGPTGSSVLKPEERFSLGAGLTADSAQKKEVLTAQKRGRALPKTGESFMTSLEKPVIPALILAGFTFLGVAVLCLKKVSHKDNSH